jgi:hypothetical protein
MNNVEHMNPILSLAQQHHWRKRIIIQYAFFGIAWLLFLFWVVFGLSNPDELFTNRLFISGLTALMLFVIISRINWRYRWNFLVEGVFEVIAYRNSTSISELMRYFRASEELIVDIIYSLILKKRVSGRIEKGSFILSIMQLETN